MKYYFRALFFCAGAFALASIGILALTLNRQVAAIPAGELTRSLAQVISNAATTTAKVDAIATAWDQRQQYQAQQMDGILHEARQTLMETRRAVYQVNTVAIPKILAGIDQNTNALAAFVGHTDQNLNQEALPQLTRSLAATQTQVAGLSAGLAASEQKFTQLTADLDATIADPANRDTLKHLDGTMANLQDITQHTDHMIARLDQPRRFWTAIATTLIDTAAKAGSIVAGFVK